MANSFIKLLLSLAPEDTRGAIDGMVDLWAVCDTRLDFTIKKVGSKITTRIITEGTVDASDLDKCMHAVYKSAVAAASGLDKDIDPEACGEFDKQDLS